MLIAYFLQVQMDGLHLIKTGTIMFDSSLNVSILNVSCKWYCMLTSEALQAVIFV